jgi:hypothetical protein
VKGAYEVWITRECGDVSRGIARKVAGELKSIAARDLAIHLRNPPLHGTILSSGSCPVKRVFWAGQSDVMAIVLSILDRFND